MTDPIVHLSTSPRHGLPLLFAAQAQKEVVLNESLARLDALSHPAVEDELAAPPSTPLEGQCWLVAPAATGGWAGHDGAIAAFSGGDWLFLEPRDGMRCWMAATGQWLRFENGWSGVTAPAVPSGGTMIDSESRNAIAALINLLKLAGIFPR